MEILQGFAVSFSPMTGGIAMGVNKITSATMPTAADDLTRKGYVDAQDSLKEDKANKGAVNGYAGLDSAGKVPMTQLPDLAMIPTKGLGFVDKIPTQIWSYILAFVVLIYATIFISGLSFDKIMQTSGVFVYYLFWALKLLITFQREKHTKQFAILFSI